MTDSSSPRCVATGRLLPALALCLFACAAPAQQQLTFASSGNSEAPSIADDGSRVAFQSAADLDDGIDNSDGSTEIFVVDTDGSDPVQITDSDAASEQASLSSDGSRVVFRSAADPAGNNGDNNVELFIADTGGAGDITQITDTQNATGIQNPVLAGDSARIAFTATGDLLGDGSNQDGSREVFASDADGDNLAQLTDGPVNTAAVLPAISPDGERVAFVADTDPVGDNTDGTREVFTVDSSGNNDPVQVTDTDSGQSSRPSIADDGRIAFESTADLDDGDTAGSQAIFVTDESGTDITRIAAGGNASIAGNGATVVFQSESDLDDNNNNDGSTEIFAADSDGGNLRQLTDSSTGASAGPDISETGERVAFQSSADLTGNNSQGNTEIFVVDISANGSDDDSNGDDSLFCSDDSSGCVLCGDDDSDDSDNDNGDATLALLALLCAFRLSRRSTRQR